VTRVECVELGSQKLFAVNKFRVIRHLHMVEVVGSEPTNSFNNLAGMTVAAFAAFYGKSSGRLIFPSFRQHHVNRRDHRLRIWPRMPQVRLDVFYRSSLSEPGSPSSIAGPGS
jgi:hypothetical protein